MSTISAYLLQKNKFDSSIWSLVYNLMEGITITFEIIIIGWLYTHQGIQSSGHTYIGEVEPSKSSVEDGRWFLEP